MTRTARRALTGTVLVAMAVLATALLGPGDGDAPLDPRSTGPSGAAALVELLQELGAEVHLDRAPTGTTDVAVVLVDALGPATAPDGPLAAWVRRGGRLVVADPASPLVDAEVVGVLDTSVVGPVPIQPACPEPALAAVEVVRAVRFLALEAPEQGGPTTARCFPVSEGWWLLVREVGSGSVVALGGGDPFTNQRLADGDNAVLAAALIGPGPGTEVVVVEDVLAAEGGGVADLVPRRVVHTLWWLVAAFLVTAWWRGRRLGPPVEEQLPLEIPAGELVRAVGELLHRSGNRGEAARLLADELRIDLADALGTDAALPATAIAELVAARTGHDAEAVRRTLEPPTPVDDEALVELARRIARIRAAVRGATPVA